MTIFEMAWVLSALLYVGLDSRRRWPGSSFGQRLGKLLRFER